VAVSETLKPSAQCSKAAKTAQTVLGQISRAFHYRDRHVFIRLYKQYVRPHLEFSTQAWSPWSVADRETLEKVQKRAVKMVSGLKGESYEDRLKELELTTLEERRHQADMQMVHKIMNGYAELDPETWFERETEPVHATRSVTDPLNIKFSTGRLEVRRNFFSVRVIQSWNVIPIEIRQRTSPESFKRAYKAHREATASLA
jgi:hypothetical protein